MEDRIKFLEVLKTAQSISDFGPTVVDQLNVTERKRLFSMIIEAFRSYSAFAKLIKEHYLVQSCAVLRVFVEEVSKIVILEEHPELYEKFADHCRVREKVLDKTQKERKLTVLKEFGLSDNQFNNALCYLDYGWIRSLSKKGAYGYHKMLKLAGVEQTTVVAYVDNLDQFIHQNVDSCSLSNEGFELFEMDNMYLSFVYFEKLLVSFQNITGKTFVLGGKRLLEDLFWPVYEEILKPEDKIS